MFIIVNKNTNKVKQTIDKNYGIEVGENELLQDVNADFMTKLNTAHNYELIFTDGVVTDITVIQTIAEYEASLPPVVPPKTELELLQERVIKAEEVSRGNSLANQELIELLIDMEVI